MALTLGWRLKAVDEIVMGLWEAFALVLEDHYMAFVQSVSDELEIIICGTLLVVSPK